MCRSVLTVALVALASAGAVAHHSFAAEWDSKKCREFTGTLAKLDWQNPHPYFFVDVKDASGKVQTWSFQAYSPVTLRRNGTAARCSWTTSARKYGCAAAWRRTARHTPPRRAR